MRSILSLTSIMTLLLATLPVPAIGQQPTPPAVDILDAGIVDGHILRVDVATPELGAQPGNPPELALDAWPGGVHVHGSLLLIGVPSRVPIPVDADLSEGSVKVGVVKVGEFPPVARFTENVKFPVQVTLRQGGRAATVHRTVTVLLPTVIVPGYANELGGRDDAALSAFRRHGYKDTGNAPTLFWFGYQSHELTLEQAAHVLADYVHRTVLASAYAAKINVVGYSLGGLLARWNVQFDVDGWGTLVNRLLLVGVPNEGTVVAYMYRNVPTFVPYGYLAHAPAAHAMMPTFPFWRESNANGWSVPADADNPTLAELNRQPMPSGVQIDVFYGSAQNTVTGVTDNGAPTLGPGDGIVPAASAEGLPIQGGSGVPALLSSNVVRVDLGSVGHSQLMSAAVIDRFTAALLQRIDSIAEAPSQKPQGQ
jgi:Lipase (class 2)